MSDDSLPITHLLLVRHGETDANVSSTWQGSTDSPLNARGRGQSQALGQRLAAEGRNIAAIYSSPLGRAQETAGIIAQALDSPPLHLDPDLAEFHLGAWEGLSYDDLRHEKRLWERMTADPTFAPPDGESALAFATRLLRAFQRIKTQHAGQTVLVVSHGGALATAMAMVLERDGSRWLNYMLANCSLSELVWDAEPRLVRLNDTSHLDGGNQPQQWGTS